jgi:hypothetical protein
MLKNNLSFVLSLVATLGLLVLAFFKDVDISMTLPAIVTGYVLGRAGNKASNVWAASKDPGADTINAIEKTDGK